MPGRLRQPARLHLGPGPARAVRRAPDARARRGAAGAVRHARAGSSRGTALAGLPVHITEFNSSYRPDNPIHDTAFHAAYLAPVLADGGELVDSFSYWTFSDMFEEVGVPTALFHGGFGLLTHRQIKKPTYHLYAFMARMGDQVLARGEDHLVTRDATAASPCWRGRRWTSTGTPACRPAHLRCRPGRAGRRSFVLRSSVSEERQRLGGLGEMGRPRSPRPSQLDTLREAAEPARATGACRSPAAGSNSTSPSPATRSPWSS